MRPEGKGLREKAWSSKQKTKGKTQILFFGRVLW